MERDIRLNWTALVEEARRRRKEQGLTQKRLAAIADVSTPTVSRFESGERNIQLASILAVLGALGMVEYPNLTFPDKTERHDFDRGVVLFLGQTADGEIACAISVEALTGHFGANYANKRSALAAFRTHRTEIETAARRKYDRRQLEKDGSVLVTSLDL